MKFTNVRTNDRIEWIPHQPLPCVLFRFSQRHFRFVIQWVRFEGWGSNNRKGISENIFVWQGLSKHSLIIARKLSSTYCNHVQQNYDFEVDLEVHAKSHVWKEWSWWNFRTVCLKASSRCRSWNHNVTKIVAFDLNEWWGKLK